MLCRDGSHLVIEYSHEDRDRLSGSRKKTAYLTGLGAEMGRAEGKTRGQEAQEAQRTREAWKTAESLVRTVYEFLRVSLSKDVAMDLAGVKYSLSKDVAMDSAGVKYENGGNAWGSFTSPGSVCGGADWRDVENCEKLHHEMADNRDRKTKLRSENDVL